MKALIAMARCARRSHGETLSTPFHDGNGSAGSRMLLLQGWREDIAVMPGGRTQADESSLPAALKESRFQRNHDEITIIAIASTRLRDPRMKSRYRKFESALRNVKNALRSRQIVGRLVMHQRQKSSRVRPKKNFKTAPQLRARSREYLIMRIKKLIAHSAERRLLKPLARAMANEPTGSVGSIKGSAHRTGIFHES